MENNNVNELSQQKATCVHCKSGKCVALKNSPCAEGKVGCAFHQTEGQKAESDAKWRERMQSMSENDQSYYADKYYGGRKVWNGE